MPPLFLSAMLSVVAAANSVEINGATDCPSAEQVATSLRPLLPDGMSIGPDGNTAFVEIVGRDADGVTRLHLRLLRPDGSMVSERQLSLRGSCTSMADAVAAILAAWLTELPVPLPPRPPTFDVALGASVGSAWIGGLAATGSVEFLLGLTAWPLRLRIAGTTETARQLSLEGGEVSWRHITTALSVMFAPRSRPWVFSVDAGPILGWVTLTGRGYAVERGQSPIEYGGGGGLRGGRAFGGFVLWLDWRVHVWAQSQQAELTGSSSHAMLRSFDMMASLGVSATLFP